MDDEDALVGSSDDEPEAKDTSREKEHEEEDDEEDDEEEEEPEGMVDEGEQELCKKLSECTVEYNRQHSAVPEVNKVRDHNRPHIVSSPEKLGEMKAANTSPARWPMASQIDPAAIVVLKGRIKEDDEALHFVWYLRVVVKSMEDDADDKNALLHIPRGTCKDMLTLMARDDELCESSLITQYMPTAYNDQRILPKLNGWEPLKVTPRTVAIKPKAAGAGGKTKQNERDDRPPALGVADAADASAKKSKPVEPPPATEPAVAAPPKAKTKPATAAGSSKGKSPVAPRKTTPKAGNPFAKAKAAAGKAPVPAPAPAAAPAPAPELLAQQPMAHIMSFDPSDAPQVEESGNAGEAPAPTAETGPAPQDRMIDSSVLLQIRGGPHEKARQGETRTTVQTWGGNKSIDCSTIQKIVVPDWAASWQLELKLSSECK
jgi:hypothetical protein